MEEASLLVSATGWAYFALWSLSFYPQVLYNARRRSVVGFSADFLLCNAVKHTSYGVYNAALAFVPAVQAQYREKHGKDAAIPVTPADVAFSAHAVVLVAVQAVQYAAYERGGQVPGRGTLAVVALAVVYAAAAAAAYVPSGNLLAFVTAFSFLQLVFTTVKYAPQVLMNQTRRSTHGWSTGMCLLDLGGGVLSFAQMVAQSALTHSTSNFSGDPTKVGLAVLTIVYDLVFLAQFAVFGAAKPTSTVDGEDDENGGAHGDDGAAPTSPLLPKRDAV